MLPATRKSLDPIGTAQSIDGEKRALGSLLNVFTGTVALPAHWHLRDEIIVAGTDVGRIGGGGDIVSPSPSDSTFSAPAWKTFQLPFASSGFPLLI